MSTLPVHDQQEWEYRHLSVVSDRPEKDRSNDEEDSPEWVEKLVEVVDGLEKAIEQGWKLLSVRIEEDDSGRCWLKAYMKRRKGAAGAGPGGLHLTPGSDPEELPNPTIEMPDGSLRRSDIEKAA